VHQEADEISGRNAWMTQQSHTRTCAY